MTYWWQLTSARCWSPPMRAMPPCPSKSTDPFQCRSVISTKRWGKPCWHPVGWLRFRCQWAPRSALWQWLGLMPRSLPAGTGGPFMTRKRSELSGPTQRSGGTPSQRNMNASTSSSSSGCFATALRLFRQHCPEALQQRFGQFEPLQGRLERDGDEAFAQAWSDVIRSKPQKPGW